MAFIVAIIMLVISRYAGLIEWQMRRSNKSPYYQPRQVVILQGSTSASGRVIGSGQHGYTDDSGNWIEDAKRMALYARDNYRCLYCGKHLIPIKLSDAILYGWRKADIDCMEPEAIIFAKAELDHGYNVPFAGTHANAANYSWCILSSCKECNMSKRGLPWYEWAMRKASCKGMTPEQSLQHIITKLSTPLDGRWANDMLAAPIDSNGEVDWDLLLSLRFLASVKVKA